MLKQVYFTVKDVAHRHGRSPRTIRDWIADGCTTPAGRVPLPAVLAGKKYVIALDDLELFEARLRRARSSSFDGFP